MELKSLLFVPKRWKRGAVAIKGCKEGPIEQTISPAHEEANCAWPKSFKHVETHVSNVSMLPHQKETHVSSCLLDLLHLRRTSPVVQRLSPKSGDARLQKHVDPATFSTLFVDNSKSTHPMIFSTSHYLHYFSRDAEKELPFSIHYK